MIAEGVGFHIDVYLIVCAAILIAALVRGAAPERFLAAVLFAAHVLKELHSQIWHLEALPGQLDPGHLIIDVLLFGMIVPAAIHANRIYPLWLGAAQIVALASHLARATLAAAAASASPIMEDVVFDVQLAVLALGLAYHVARRRRLGHAYPDWRADT